MTTRSTLANTTLTGTVDGGKKRKLAVVALAIVGVTVLLRLRGGDTDTSETDDRPTESEGRTTQTTNTTPDPDDQASDESTMASVTEAQRELDMFDMLAIAAAAITSARDEYRKRTGN